MGAFLLVRLSLALFAISSQAPVIAVATSRIINQLGYFVLLIKYLVFAKDKSSGLSIADSLT